MQCAAKEATFAYHTAHHKLSFKISDCTSKLVKNGLNLNFLQLDLKLKLSLLMLSPLMFLKRIHIFVIEEKVICLSADNTNTNFGGVNRQTKGNVFNKLQKAVGRPTLGIACRAIGQ